MTLDIPLNHRQLEVLNWINDGCPPGRWTDVRFKTVAIALQSRRLASISKRGGEWNAVVLPAGVHYLTHYEYPPGHWKIRKGRTSSAERDREVQPSPSPPRQPRPARRPEPPAPDGLTPTRKLLKDIIDSGGIFELDTKEDKTSYRSLVGIINRRGMAPDGQEVIMLRGKSYHHVLFRLSSVSDWQTELPSTTMAAERIGRWHPAVATLRKDKRLDSIEKELRGKAFRLLHALTREAEARGHSVRLPRRSHHGYLEDTSKLGGDVIFKVGDIECSVNILQPKERVDHTPTAYEVEREKKYGWPPSRYDYVPANRLSIVIDTDSRFSSKESWTETKTLPLHVRLPDVMMTFERWAAIDTEAKEAERHAQIEQRERTAREEELARRAYVQHALGDRLVADANEWEMRGRLRRYLAEMALRIECIADDEERAAATDWLSWCEEYAAKRDPFAKPIRQPKVNAPGYSDIQEFRKRLGSGSGW